jgi:hypothetical protein
MPIAITPVPVPAASKALLKRRGLRGAGAAVRGVDNERKAAEETADAEAMAAVERKAAAEAAERARAGMAARPEAARKAAE